ncbi:WGxxGxxG-CTERM domain-containing protein [Oculatella sp. LEGE 06141]|uniref:WGxxGxxG family protein n=1 Tax=Oculatella sp. LEGE 06141 TaxID=1828648 RepID=UPI0018803243|nr:WGxxGxxG family protein [Oculatella sp. LEGE 06141]MBE9181345.1 WGxxGxxG-CTERM domain-containing protein [Oculatella sp. LEGE 06141]
MTKRSNTINFVGAGILALGVALAPATLTANAQTDPSPTNPTVDTTPFAESRTDSNNWGWLGLIGLLGLANLFRKSEEPTRYRDPNVTAPAGRRDEI